MLNIFLNIIKNHLYLKKIKRDYFFYLLALITDFAAGNELNLTCLKGNSSPG